MASVRLLFVSMVLVGCAAPSTLRAEAVVHPRPLLAANSSDTDDRHAWAQPLLTYADAVLAQIRWQVFVWVSGYHAPREYDFHPRNAFDVFNHSLLDARVSGCGCLPCGH
jgi:hypothetical protein